MKPEELRALLEKASPQPWTSPWEDDTPAPEFRDKDRDSVIGVTWVDGPQLMVTEPNAQAIVAVMNRAELLVELWGWCKTLESAIDSSQISAILAKLEAQP